MQPERDSRASSQSKRFYIDAAFAYVKKRLKNSIQIPITMAARPANDVPEPRLSRDVTMRGAMRSLFAFLIVVSAVCRTVSAQDTGIGLDFLNISPAASHLSISEASSAAPAGAAAIYSNPSLLAMEERSTLDLSYTLWIGDIAGQFAGVNLIRGDHAFAFAVYRSESDRFAPGGPAGSVAFPVNYLSIAASGAVTLGPLRIGAAGHYLREEVVEFRANGYAFSGGLSLPFAVAGRDVTAGISILNLGTMQDLNLQATPVPSTLRAGLRIFLFQTELPGLEQFPARFTLNTDYIQPLREGPSFDFTMTGSREPYYSFALTKQLGEIVLLHSALRLGPTERPVSFGASLGIDPVRVHYALIPFSTGYGTAHSIGLQYMF